MEYDFVGEDEIYATLADDIRAQVSELMALLSDTRATYILVPLTHEDMMKHLEIKFDKIMLAFPGKPPPWVRPDAVQEARARCTGSLKEKEIAESVSDLLDGINEKIAEVRASAKEQA